MRHFLFEDKEYQIRPGFRRAKKQEGMVSLARRFGGRRRGAGMKGGGTTRAVDRRQKCVAKMQYSGSMDAHRVQLEKCLVREGTDRDGGNAKLFGTDLEEYRAAMVDKNFRIFLSPQSPDVDLEALAGKFIERLEAQTGYRLYWQGACHYNTAHPHAHLLINGVDRQGKEVSFPRDVVKTFMRESAQDICTAQLGERSDREIALDRQAELSANRYTRLDERISALCDNGAARPANAGKDRERVQARLEHLRKMGLCSYEAGAYRMRAGWEEDLKANGRYNTFLAAREGLRYNRPESLAVYSGAAGEISGRVTKAYRTDDDASDNHAVIIESPDGNSWFVPLLKTPDMRVWNPREKKFNKMKLAEGELVSVKTYQTQKGRLIPSITRKEPRQFSNELARLSGGMPAHPLTHTHTLAREIIAAAKGRKPR